MAGKAPKNIISQMQWRVLDLLKNQHPEKPISVLGKYLYVGQERHKFLTADMMQQLYNKGYVQEWKQNHMKLSDAGWQLLFKK